ncbi:DNA cytosine methyltransferase [Actinomadura sp. KC216]|nr:DNA cytosine methyltransferase [Actinomadura sp. KC216]
MTATAPLSLGSLCTGYGGLDLAAAEVFDVRPVWVADPDPGAAAILAHHWPDVPNFGDITAVDWTTVPPIDVVCGGYPCQPFSLAGHRKGTADDRHLWPHIATALRVLRPRYAIFENVASHLRIGFADVLTDLADLGFDAEWITLRASDVGAAHQRNRLFVLARAADAQGARLQGPQLRGRTTGGGGTAAHADRVGDQRDRAAGLLAQRHPTGTGGTAAHPASVGEREPADQAHTVTRGGHARPEPGRRGVQPAAHPARDRRDEGRPEPTGQLGRPDAALGRDAAAHAARSRRTDEPQNGDPELVLAEPGPSGGDRPRRDTPRTGRDDEPADGVAWGPYAPAIHRWARILGRPAPPPRLPTGRNGADQLNPTFVEWLMGLPDGHVTDVPGLTRNQMLKALGNGVVPAQGAAALAALLARLTADRPLSEGSDAA